MMWNMDVCPTKHWNCADWLDACLVWRSCACAANKSLTIFCLKSRFMSSFSIFLSSSAMNLLKTVSSSSSTGFAWLSAFCPSKNWLMVASPLSTVCSSAAYNVYTHAPTATQSIHQYDHTAVWYNWKCSIITSRHITLVSLWAGSSVSSAGWCAPVLCSNTLWHITLVSMRLYSCIAFLSHSIFVLLRSIRCSPDNDVTWDRVLRYLLMYCCSSWMLFQLSIGASLIHRMQCTCGAPLTWY